AGQAGHARRGRRAGLAGAAAETRSTRSGIQIMNTREEIVEAVRDAQREGAAYWSAFDNEVFFQRIGESWSPSETVRHLIKSIRAVVKGLSMRRFVLRLTFGKPRRPSVTYDALRTRYLGL